MFNPAPLSPYFRWVDYIIPMGGAGGNLLILPANPMRLSLIFSVVSGNAIVGPSSKLSSTSGFNILAAGSPYVFDFAKWATIIGSQWNMVTPSSAPLYIVELIAVDNEGVP